MLIIERRENDADQLVRTARELGVEAVKSESDIEYGDCIFCGNGPDGVGSAMIGVERKKLTDLVNCIKDRRLSGHQIRGLRRTYTYVVVVTEGMWRPGRGGEIEEFRRGRDGRYEWAPFYSSGSGPGTVGAREAISYEQVVSYLTTLEFKGGVVWRRTATAAETVKQYVALYRWFNSKEWAEHTSLEQAYCGAVPIKGHGSRWADEHDHNESFGPGRVVGIAPSDREKELDHPTSAWRIAMQLPGVDSRARLLAKHFRTGEGMALAGLPEEIRERVRRWREDRPKDALKAFMAVEGARIGEKTAKAIVRAWTEEGA